MSEVALQNTADFRREWVTLCGSGRELCHHAVSFFSPYEGVTEAAQEILAAHGAAQGERYHVFLDMHPTVTDGKVLAVYTGAVPAQPLPGQMVLRTPALYGAGLPAGCGVNDALTEDDAVPAIHIADLFQVMIAALSCYAPGEYVVRDDPSEGDFPYRPLVEKGAGVRALRLLRQFPQRRFYDDTAYGGLRRLQQLQLKCLLELDRICKEHGIEYFLGGGTLLGAVRHQGFIPWDDDIDVMMTRQNFDRLAQVAPTAVGSEFFYQNSATDPWYHSPFAKLRLNDTLFATAFSSRFPETHNGIFIDIFAHDRAPRRKILLRPHIFMTTLARSMVFHKWEDTPMHFYGRWKTLCRLMTFVVRRSSMAGLERFERRVMTFWNKRRTGFLYDGMGEHLQHGRFPAELLEEKTEVLFEGHLFPVPLQYDEYLRFAYGEDYMQWPRPGLRSSQHIAVQFSLGRYGDA